MAMSTVTKTENAYLANFASRRTGLAGGDWLESIRENAMKRFRELGFPSTAEEEWKYTNVSALGRTDFRLNGEAPDGISVADLAATPLANPGCSRLVFMNGRYSAHLSNVRELPPAVRVSSLSEALRSENPGVKAHLGRYADFENRPFVALNTAFIEDGAFIEIPADVVVGEPIYFLFLSAGDAGAFVTHPRNLILFGRGSQATIIEGYLGLGGAEYFTNPLTEIVVGENAVADHYKLQSESEAAFHIAALHVQQERSSRVVSHNVSFGGGLVRNDIDIVLGGEGSECILNGLYVAGGTQHIDNHTVIDHATPHCNSRELYKGILDGKSTAVFNGRIIVRKDAQKTNARQTNRNLLLSGEAEINTKPELQILADDVKCTHGATIGQIDREALFYLNSRGIGREEARNLLTYAFANEVLASIRDEAIRAGIETALKSSLSGDWSKRTDGE